MEQLNKKIKDIYNQEQASLPAEFSWDEMKDGIYKKMKEQEDEPVPVLPFFIGRKNWWLFISASFLVLASMFTYFKLNDYNLKSTNNIANNYEPTPKAEKALSNKSIEDKVLKSIDESYSKLDKSNLVSKSDETKPVEKVTPPNNKTLNNSAIANTNHKSINKLVKTNKTSSNDKPYSTPSYKKDIEPILENLRISNVNETQPIDKKLNHSKNKQTINKTKINDNNSTVINETRFKIVEPITKKNSKLKSGNQSSIQVKETIVNPDIEKQAEEHKSDHALQLDGGFTYLFSLYKKSDSKQYRTEKGFPSVYTSLNYSKVFPNKIYISTGLNYSKYKTKFELSDTIIHTYLVENAHTLSIENLVTGKTSDIFEDVNVDAPSIRTARHYNRFDAISIPVVIGKQFKHKKLRYNIGLGSDISFYNLSAGKTLRANEVISYSQKDIIPYSNKVQVATLLELGMGLAVNKHIDITANFRYKKHLANWANDNLSIKPQAVLLGAGLKFKF